MRYAIISDIHANPTALRAVLADAQAQKVDSFICLGDCVGYGPLPREALQLIRQYCATTLLGNHDWAVVNPASAKDFVDVASESIERHRAELTADDLEWLKKLPRTVTFGNVAAAHADFTDKDNFYYVESAADAKANFTVRPEQLLFVGHTHTPSLFVTGESGEVYAIAPCDFALEEGKRYLVNPGSVGYPRKKDGTCQSSYVIYDSEAKSVYFRYLPFDVSGLLQRGCAPKVSKSRKGLFFALGAALLLLLSSLVFIGTYFAAPERESVERVLIEKALPLEPTDIEVRANLKLAKDSAPVTLEVHFLSVDDKDIAPAQIIAVKKSSLRAFKVPKNTKKATFSIHKLAETDSPRIEVFAPTRTSAMVSH